MAAADVQPLTLRLDSVCAGGVQHHQSDAIYMAANTVYSNPLPTSIDAVMRLSEDKIKRAILHPEGEIRRYAASYFADSPSDDPDVMPLVIEAVQRYGLDSSFWLLRKAEQLVQTPATVSWLFDALRRDFDIRDIKSDNFRFALSLVVLAAPVEQLRERKQDIDGLASFPVELRRRRTVAGAYSATRSNWPSSSPAT